MSVQARCVLLSRYLPAYRRRGEPDRPTLASAMMCINSRKRVNTFQRLFCSPACVSLHEKLRLDPDTGVSAKYLLASLESDPERLTKDDQVKQELNDTARCRCRTTVPLPLAALLRLQ